MGAGFQLEVVGSIAAGLLGDYRGSVTYFGHSGDDYRVAGGKTFGNNYAFGGEGAYLDEALLGFAALGQPYEVGVIGCQQN